MNRVVVACVSIWVFFVLAQTASCHCEIPCGIYGDESRFEMIEEHITTVAKSIETITSLSEEEDKNHNQMVRWIDNKEAHADQIQDIVCQYFMTQRVKPVGETDTVKYTHYVKQLTLLHEMLIYAMRVKQTTDLGNTQKLKSLLEEFRLAYLGAEEEEQRD